MKTFPLLILASLLWMPAVAASPTGSVSHQVGDLAKDRLQGIENILLPTDQVLVAKSGQIQTPIPPTQAKIVSQRLTDLVRDDALYVEDGQGEWNGRCEIVTVGTGLQATTIFINLDKPVLRLFDGNRSVIADYAPVLSKIVSLLQAIDPHDSEFNDFHPSSPPVAAAKMMPASVLARIATIKPGMTRADVFKVFTTEGGVSTTYWNHYVYQEGQRSVRNPWAGVVRVNGELIKVNVDFAPRDADIVWLNGRGFWLHQNEYWMHHQQYSAEERSDDVILRVSLPYLQAMVTD